MTSLSNFGQAIDFVLIDLWKALYSPCLEAVYPRLSHGAFIAADNILAPAWLAAEWANPGPPVHA